MDMLKTEIKEIAKEICKMAKQKLGYEKARILTSPELPNFASIELVPQNVNKTKTSSFIVYNKRKKDGTFVTKLGTVAFMMPRGYLFNICEEEKNLLPDSYDIICYDKVDMVIIPLSASTSEETEDGLISPLENSEEASTSILSSFKEKNTMNDIYLSPKTSAKYVKLTHFVENYNNWGKCIDELIEKKEDKKFVDYAIQQHTIESSIINPLCNVIQMITGKNECKTMINRDSENEQLVTLMFTNDEESTIMGMSLLIDKITLKMYKAVGRTDNVQKIELPNNIIDIIPLFGTIQKRKEA